MYSPNQHEDKKFLLELNLLIQQLAKLATTEALDLAEKFGEHYFNLEKKIKSHDYTNEDKHLT
jgi:hypothetical protein